MPRGSKTPSPGVDSNSPQCLIHPTLVTPNPSAPKGWRGGSVCMAALQKIRRITRCSSCRCGFGVHRLEPSRCWQRMARDRHCPSERRSDWAIAPEIHTTIAQRLNQLTQPRWSFPVAPRARSPAQNAPAIQRPVPSAGPGADVASDERGLPCDLVPHRIGPPTKLCSRA